MKTNRFSSIELSEYSIEGLKVIMDFSHSKIQECDKTINKWFRSHEWKVDAIELRKQYSTLYHKAHNELCFRMSFLYNKIHSGVALKERNKKGFQKWWNKNRDEHNDRIRKKYNPRKRKERYEKSKQPPEFLNIVTK